MIELQVRDKGSDAWRRVAEFLTVNAPQVDIIEHSRQVARLIDRATGQVVAQSLPARGIPVDKIPEGIIREFVLSLRRPEEVEQATPDVNRKTGNKMVVKRVSHKAFATDGY